MTEHRKKFPKCPKFGFGQKQSSEFIDVSQQLGFKDIRNEHQSNVWNDFYLNKQLKKVQCKHCFSVMKIFTNIMTKHLETCDNKLTSSMEENSCDEENSTPEKDTPEKDIPEKDTSEKDSWYIKKYVCKYTKCDQTFSRESSMYHFTLQK